MESITIILIGGFVGLIISTFNTFFNPIQWVVLCGVSAWGIYLVVMCWISLFMKEDDDE